MLTELRKLLADCDFTDAQFFFNNLFGTNLNLTIVMTSNI